MSSIIIIFHLYLLGIFFGYTLEFIEINQIIFHNPQTNISFIRCPLENISSLNIQWYDLNKQQYDNNNRGRYYRIETGEYNQRQLICSNIFNNENIKFFIRIYDRPLPIEHISIINITNTSLTVQWKNNLLNSNCNITGYELILKYDHFIQYRILVNNSFSIYTFSSLHSSTFYLIDISVIDQWKRSSRSKTILSQTLPYKSQKKIFFNKIIDFNQLDQSINCYKIQSNFLFIEFNSSKYQILNHIYNLTIFNDNNNQILFNKIIYSSFIYHFKHNQLKYQIQLHISTIQSEYLGIIIKKCQDIYSSITCSIKFIDINQYDLRIYQHYQQIHLLYSNFIYYHVNQSSIKKMNISNLKYFIIDRINEYKKNYSIIIENNILYEKFNISIICSISSRLFFISSNRLSNGIKIILVLVFFIFISLIIHRYFQNFQHQSIPIERFSSYVSLMHEKNNLGFNRLYQNIKKINYYSHVQFLTNEYIDDYGQINGYITTQQPLIDTITKFWRMIWIKDVNVIVMMTNSNNRGNNQSFVYWPEEGSKIYEEFQITLINCESYAYYIKRIFIIQCRIDDEKFIEDKRLIHHFHYIYWPDDGVPDYPLSVLSFVRACSSCHSEIGGPMVVHCSSGINSTGTYIIIDAMLKAIDKQLSLTIPIFLEHLQQQRYDLIQTKEQFIFIYDVLREAVESLNWNLSINEKQFQKFPKNIDQQLMNISSHLHGYHRLDQFIIIKHPTMNKIIDFWKMIWNTQSDIIIGLYADENLSTNEFNYWPRMNEIIDCENIHVDLIDEYFQCEYIYRNCLIRSIEDNRQLLVRIISISYWPETCSPIQTSFDLIDRIRKFHSLTPIVVHDLDGGYRAATFCVLYTIKEQIEYEEMPNVYELAKFYSIKRPGIWRNSNDLLFLYHCAKILIEEECNNIQ